MSYANSKGADQPAHPRSLISAFVVRCLGNIISLYSIAEISRLKLTFVPAQVGLCLVWSETPEDTFCRVVAQTNDIMLYLKHKNRRLQNTNEFKIIKKRHTLVVKTLHILFIKIAKTT